MLALHLFLTIALSLSASAFDDYLSMLPRSNTSDGNDLLDSKRSLVQRDHFVKRFTVDLTLDKGLLTAPAYFAKQLVPSVVLNTGSGATWIRANPANAPIHTSAASPTVYFEFMGEKIEGLYTDMQNVVLKAPWTLVSRLRCVVVASEKSHIGYEGGLGLDRRRTSWPNSNSHHQLPPFAISYGETKITFDYVNYDENLKYKFKYLNVQENSNEWSPVERAKIIVGGRVVRQVATFETVFDTGLPYIYGDELDVRNVYKNVKNSKHVKNEDVKDGFWMVPCGEKPMVSILWIKLHALPIHKFVMDDESTEVDGQKYCRGVLQVWTYPGRTNHLFRVGVPFFLEKYAVFHPGEKWVAFAPL